MLVSMKKRKFMAAALACLLSAGFVTSCDDDDDSSSEKQISHAVSVELPLTLTDAVLTNATVVMTNVNTGAVYTTTIDTTNLSEGIYEDTVMLTAGTYNIVVTGVVSYTVDGQTLKSNVKATQDNVVVSEAVPSTMVALNVFNAKEGLVITEIFFTGTTTSEGKQYGSDQYIKIGNNSDTTMYLDGLGFVESAFLTTTKQEYTPDIMNQAMSVDAIYIIPGSGKEYPIAPGQEVVLALNGKNHKEVSSTAVDLSGADFEFYDLSTVASVQDDDNPDVTNLINWYDYSASIFSLHNRGFKAYAIIKPEVDSETFLTDYKYDASYTFVYGDFSKEMTTTAYKVPNTWVVDAVNLSVSEGYEWNVTSSTLDAGWAHCGTTTSDKDRYNKSVIRKKNGSKWVDTNNSTDDFENEVTPSLLN